MLRLYRVLSIAALPFLVVYLLWRGARDRRYWRRLGERFGMLPPFCQRTAPDSVWLHAVSVGEVLSAVELVRELRLALPGSPVFLSCTTLAGREAAVAKLYGLVDGIFYAPFDYVFAVRSVLRRMRPAVVVILETEIWPNLYREAKRAGCALLIVNGRISDRALPRYRRLSWFFRRVLRLPDRILVQSEQDRDRYITAGAPPSSVTVAGNLKYDFDPTHALPPAAVSQWLSAGSGPLWIAASTVGPQKDGDVDEDDAVIRAWQEMPEVRLLIAPRKPERFEAVAAKLRQAGLRFAARTALPEKADTPALLLDSVGELGGLFRFADVVFMGGTLAHRGGHNILEPALFARAIVAGPHMENFAAVQRKFRAGEGFLEIESPGELTPAIRRLLSDPALRSQLGARARTLAESERGATSRAVSAIVEERWAAVPTSVPRFRVVLKGLSYVWIAGGSLKRRLARPGRLTAPVISVGGLAMGGAGKTPIVRALALALRDRGLQPAVLTRGYGRRSGEAVTVIPAGGTAPVDVTGDEAQTILRDGAAHLGIGADRYLAGKAVESQLHTDVFILDDGFQHARLHRDLDIVVLDGLDPFAGGGVFPLGRLREPVERLKRADAVVIARADERLFHATADRIYAVNPDVPVLLSGTDPVQWSSLRTGQNLPLNALTGEPVAAFCGLGNPESFRSTLERLNCTIVLFRTFPDHYVYTREDMERLASDARTAGVAWLVTTEKDAVKLQPAWIPEEPQTVTLNIQAAIDSILDLPGSRRVLSRGRVETDQGR